MSLTDKTVGGFFWAFGERFGIQAMQMVIFIVLARVLTPEAFGLMGMLAVFVAICQSLTDSGFGQALIQKKETDDIDYSSVFFMNLIISVLIYFILFSTAPFLSSFYGEPILVDMIRVLGLKFIISSFSLVQISRLTKEVQFKKLMIAKLPSTLLGGIVGISAAYLGFGVWSLIIQQLTDATAYSIQIWIQSKWSPLLVFRWDRVKSLFDFGGKMLGVGILNVIYSNLYIIVIGRYFSAAKVGFYNQADKIKQLPIQNISNSLLRVTFPILSEIQDDDRRLKRAYKKILQRVMLFIAPLMLGGIVLAEPLFSFVLTDKWLPAVPYFQWLCVNGLFYPVSSFNLNIIKVKGRSDLILWLSIFKKIIEGIGVFIVVQYSVLALVIFRAAFGIVGYGINSYYSGKFINYKLSEQLFDITKILFTALIMMGCIAFLESVLNVSDGATLGLGIITGGLIYIVMTYFSNKKLFNDVVQFFINEKNEIL